MKGAVRFALDERRARVLDGRAAIAEEKNFRAYLKSLDAKAE